MSYVINKLVTDLCPTKPRARWVAEKVLNIPPALIASHSRNLGLLVYKVYFSIKPTDNKYVTAYNSARCDLIAELIPTVYDKIEPISIAYEPEGNLQYWLASTVLLFSDEELVALCGIHPDNVDEPTYEYIPLLRSSYRFLRKLKLQDPALQGWHRARHVMLRYFLDAVYHEI